jgi:hypothetical protein
MLQASLHARKQQLKIKIVHLANPEYGDPFHVLTLTATGGGEFKTFLDYHQLQQIANAINEFLATTANDTAAKLTETTNAHAS